MTEITSAFVRGDFVPTSTMAEDAVGHGSKWRQYVLLACLAAALGVPGTLAWLVFHEGMTFEQILAAIVNRSGSF